MSLAGAVVWGVVPFAPQAPFRLYAGPDHDPIVVQSAEPLINASKKGGDPQFTHLVAAKARPVLIVSGAHADDLDELLALRLSRFSKLTAEEQESIRAQQHPTLFHLRPDKFPGLAEENAAMIAGLVRVHRSAVGDEELGRLDDYELTTVHERLVRFHQLNLHGLVMEQLKQLAARQAAKKKP